LSNYQIQHIFNLSPRKDDLHARPTETIEVMKRQKRRKQIKEKQIDLMHCAELIYLSQQGKCLTASLVNPSKFR